MPEPPTRKPARLERYDYTQNGAYFVTICTKDRQNLFWNPVGADTIRPDVGRAAQNATALPAALTGTGKIVRQAVENIPKIYPTITLDKYVVMPDHVHLLLRFAAPAGTAVPALSTVVGQMKRWASKESGLALWQKSYYEHVIRNEADYQETWNYIEGNPSRWLEKHGH